MVKNGLYTLQKIFFQGYIYNQIVGSGEGKLLRIRNWKCLLILLSICLCCLAQEDTLTQALCKHNEQIVSEVDGIRVQYKIHGYTINGKTAGGYLHNNPASNPYFKRYQACKTSAYICTGLGFGAIITNLVIGKGAPLTLAGVGLAGFGLYINFRGNHLFRVAIYEYNKNICRIK